MTNVNVDPHAVGFDRNRPSDISAEVFQIQTEMLVAIGKAFEKGDMRVSPDAGRIDLGCGYSVEHDSEMHYIIYRPDGSVFTYGQNELGVRPHTNMAGTSSLPPSSWAENLKGPSTYDRAMSADGGKSRVIGD